MGPAKKNLVALMALLLIITVCSFFAYQIEHDWGRVDIKVVKVSDYLGSGAVLSGKLYKPADLKIEKNGTEVKVEKRPAILAIHGYQNDRDTQNAFAMEFSRRGYVVLSMDQWYHGDSNSLPATFPADPSNGGNTGFKYLKTLPFVDAANIGIMGHSRGSVATYGTAQMNPDHKALNPQCGRAYPAEGLNNVLLTQASFDEFDYFRESQPTFYQNGNMYWAPMYTRNDKGVITGSIPFSEAVKKAMPLQQTPVRLKNFGPEFDRTYGSFANGTARRVALIEGTHPAVTHSDKAVKEALDWMNLALKNGKPETIPTDQHVFMRHEYLTLIALLACLACAVPLTNLLLMTRLFASVPQPISSKPVVVGKKWWLSASINALLAGITWVLLTERVGVTNTIGGIIQDKLLPLNVFEMEMGRGPVIWYLGNAIIAGVIFYYWYQSAKKKGITLHDLGVSFNEKAFGIDWVALGKHVLLGVMVVGFMYVLTGIADLFGVQFRFLWPFMRTYSDPHRVAQFLINVVPALLFCLINLGIYMFGQIRQPEYGSETKTQFIWWLKICYAGLAGLALVWMFQYVPAMYLGLPLGFEMIGLMQYSAMWPLMLMIFIPQFMVMLFLAVFFFRKTGKIYAGSVVVAFLSTWFLTSGSVITHIFK